MKDRGYYIFWSAVTLIINVTMSASVIGVQLNGC